MNGNTILASVGGCTLRYRHLMVIAILAAAVAVAFLIRAQPAQYGFELNEFDPFFNYRATLYMVENGIPAYYEWHDTMSWYPNGRDVSATSQVALHMAAAVTYQMFGGGMPLYNYTILFPAVFGALTAVSIFALVRVMGGTSAGLFAAMLYSVSLPILVRSPMGWFKSEPFGLFLSITAAYLFVSGLYSASRGTAAARMIGAGLLVSSSVSAWGGNQFLIIAIGVLFLALPFLRRDHSFLLWVVPLFAASVLATSLLFERGVVSTPFSVLALAASAGFLVACIIIQKKSAQHKTRNGLIFLAAVLAVLPAGGVILAESNAVNLPSYRYLNALNPFMTTEIPLVESVAEHATTTLQQSFLFHTVFMIFAGIGAWLVIRALARYRQDRVYVRPDMLAFALIIGMAGVYISSSYVRLEVFAAVSVIVMASLGLGMLSREFLGRGGIGMHGDDSGTGESHTAQDDRVQAGGGDGDDDDGLRPLDDASRPQGGAAQTRTSGPKQLSARAQRRAVRVPTPPRRGGSGRQGGRRPVPGILSMPYVAGIVALLLLPLIYSGSGASDVFTITDTPPTILTGGASFGTPTGDWTDALSWIRNSTSPDAVIAAWWDYGYWISTVGERTSLADNATIDSERIERLADMFISAPDDAWRDLRDLDADYVLVFVAGQLLQSESPVPLYSLQHGGDESKKQWFIRIGGHDPNLYLHMDGLSGTEYFWESTTVAHLFPFSLATYVNPANPAQQFPTYVPGAVAIYSKDVKYPADGDGPFRLAYSSPSFEAEVPGPMIGVFIYEVNDEYVPADEEAEPDVQLQPPSGGAAPPPESDSDVQQNGTAPQDAQP